jgi:replication-associated recombination protein RarA
MQTASNLTNSHSNSNAPGFAFPQSLAEKYRPRKISGFAGLEKQRKILSNFIKNPYDSAWMFVGASGTGKTSLAMAVASELGSGAEVHHVGSQQCKLDTLENVVRMCSYVPLNGGFHVVICDEFDAASDAAQKYLLSKLDSSEPVPNTVWIFSANSIEHIETRFLSRCRVLEFSTYGMSDAICEYLEGVWKAECPNETCPNLKRLVTETHSNVRESLMRLELEMMAM